MQPKKDSHLEPFTVKSLGLAGIVVTSGNRIWLLVGQFIV